MRVALLSLVLLGFAVSCKKPPIACIEVDNTSASTGVNVTFTSCSEKSLSYEWYMSGPVGAPENSMGWSDPEFSHAFTLPGTYTVSLTAYADFSWLGESSTTETTIVIN